MHTMSQAEWIAFANHATRTGKLGVVRADGSAHVTPVWFLVDAEGTEVIFTTEARSVKGKALARDPRFTVCVDDQAPPYGYVVLHAEATLVDCAAEPAATLRDATRLGTRYMGAERGAEYGARNAVPGEYLVRGRITRVIARAGIAD